MFARAVIVGPQNLRARFFATAISRQLFRDVSRDRPPSRGQIRRDCPDRKWRGSNGSIALTITQCCRLAAIGRTKFYGLGDIPVCKVGKKTLVAAADLRRWADRLPAIEARPADRRCREAMLNPHAVARASRGLLHNSHQYFQTPSRGPVVDNKYFPDIPIAITSTGVRKA